MNIGIVGNTSNDFFKIGKPYYDYFDSFGRVFTLPVLEKNENISKWAGFFDLIILPGGADVDTVRYNERPSVKCGQPDIYLEYFDLYTLPRIISMGIPVFGICRGLQTINVHFGGSLYQNIYHPYSSKDRGELIHEISPHPYDKTKKNEVKTKVNSLHHQAIKRLGAGIIPLYTSHDFYVEAIHHETLPVAAVQWHPEEIWDEISTNLIKNILK